MKATNPAVDLNNNACLLLQKKNQQKAIDTLQAAYQILKNEKNRSTEAKSRCKYNFCSFGDNPFRTILIAHDELPCPSSSGWKFYNRALAINNLTGSSLKEIRAKSRVSILYNLGLTYHHEGLSSSHPKRFAKALRFYELAISALKSKQGSIPSQDTMILFLPLLNNMIHIHTVLNHDEKARVSFELMRYILRSLEDVTHIKFSEDDLKFLRKNIKSFYRKEWKLVVPCNNETTYLSEEDEDVSCYKLLEESKINRPVV